MNKVFERTASVVVSTVVSIAFLIFGVGCVYVALTNINLTNIQVAEINDTSVYSITDEEIKAIQMNTKDEAVILQTEQIQEVIEIKQAVVVSYPVKGDVIGSLLIPSLDIEVPIIEGTEADELARGVGHFIQSVLPGEEDNCVLSGHRDTIFMKLGGILIGDQVIVKTAAGIFVYEVSGTRIVDKDDKTVIVPTDTAVLTLTTCYPFIFVGAAPDRFIVTADLLRIQ
ncbi:MAG: class D sortase [Clostridia bacterium]